MEKEQKPLTSDRIEELTAITNKDIEKAVATASPKLRKFLNARKS